MSFNAKIFAMDRGQRLLEGIVRVYYSWGGVAESGNDCDIHMIIDPGSD